MFFNVYKWCFCRTLAMRNQCRLSLAVEASRRALVSLTPGFSFSPSLHDFCRRTQPSGRGRIWVADLRHVRRSENRPACIASRTCRDLFMSTPLKKQKPKKSPSPSVVLDFQTNGRSHFLGGDPALLGGGGDAASEGSRNLLEKRLSCGAAARDS